MNRLRNALHKHGGVGALRALGSRVRERFFPKPVPVHPFDHRYGVDTSGVLWTRKLRSGHANDPHITGYYGTSPSLFRGLMAQWQESLSGTPYQLHDFTLIDIGCGKGRALMMASDLPFHRIVGVELNPRLAAIARANLARWNATPHICTDVSVLVTDALNAPLPESATLLYVYHPFDEHVMRPFLERLSRLSRGRGAPIDIIYIHPVHADVFQTTPGMAQLWTGDLPIAPEDTAVDAFGSTSQDVAIYRLLLHREREHRL